MEKSEPEEEILSPENILFTNENKEKVRKDSSSMEFPLRGIIFHLKLFCSIYKYKLFYIFIFSIYFYLYFTTFIYKLLYI